MKRYIVVACTLAAVLISSCQPLARLQDGPAGDGPPEPRSGDFAPPPLPPESAPSKCTGNAQADYRRLIETVRTNENDQTGNILVCSARFAAERLEYRALMAHWLVRAAETAPLLSDSPAYRDWARTTQLSFGSAVSHRLPETWVRAGYSVLAIFPSPDGRYMASQLSDLGGAVRIGWWATAGSTHELYQEAGYDVVWHPREPKFSYVSRTADGHRIHTVALEPEIETLAADVSGYTELRFPAWAQANSLLSLYPSESSTVVAVGDPGTAPRGVAYLQNSGSVASFDVSIVADAIDQLPHIPGWVAQPWDLRNGYLVTQGKHNLWSYRGPQEGRKTLFHIPAGVQPLSLTWSPRGLSVALVERRPDLILAHVSSPDVSYDGHEPIYELPSQHLAISDDGATIFVVLPPSGGQTVVRARNVMTGKEQEWEVEGDVRGILLGTAVLYVMQRDLIQAIPYRTASP